MTGILNALSMCRAAILDFSL